MPSVNIILARVESGELDLPKFQRGYVWQRWQVRNLFDSLYKGHPVGSLLTWLSQIVILGLKCYLMASSVLPRSTE